MPSPTLTITYGPPGSGKSRIIHLLGINTAAAYNANVDDIVAQNPDYQSEIKKCREYYSSLSLDDAPSKSVNEACAAIYFKYRPAADAANDKALAKALAAHQDIIFETTGRSIDWIIADLLPRARDYHISIVYPVTSMPILLSRILSRARAEGRYPSPEYVSEVNTRAQSNFVPLYEAAQRQSAHPVDVYVYDNDAEPKIIVSKTADGIKCAHNGTGMHPSLQHDLYRFFCNKSGGMIYSMNIPMSAIIVIALCILLIWLFITFKPRTIEKCSSIYKSDIDEYRVRQSIRPNFSYY